MLCESPSSAFDSKGLLTNALKATILQKERCCILVGSVEPTVMLLLLHRESWLVLRLTGVVTPVGLAVSHPGSGHNRGLATARHSTCGAVHHGTGDAVAGPAAVAAGHPTAQQCCRYRHSVAVSQHPLYSSWCLAPSVD